MSNGHALFDVCWSLIAQANPENELFLSDMSIFWNCNSKLCYYLTIVAYTVALSLTIMFELG